MIENLTNAVKNYYNINDLFLCKDERRWQHGITCSSNRRTSERWKVYIFNRIVGSRVSIVEDEPGITRDRIYSSGEWLTRKFNVIDTGGY